VEANLSGEEAGRGATGTLEDIRQAGRYIEEYVTDPNSKPEYYLIKYDRQGGTVRVESHREPISGVTSLDTLEVTNSEKGEKNVIEGILRMGCKAADSDAYSGATRCRSDIWKGLVMKAENALHTLVQNASSRAASVVQSPMWLKPVIPASRSP
jgi:hypothetical protein